MAHCLICCNQFSCHFWWDVVSDHWSSGMYTHDPRRASREKELRDEWVQFFDRYRGFFSCLHLAVGCYHLRRTFTKGLRWWGTLTCIFPSNCPFFSWILAWRSVGFEELTLGRMPIFTRRSRASTFQTKSAQLSKNGPMVTFASDGQTSTSWHWWIRRCGGFGFFQSCSFQKCFSLNKNILF